MANKKWNGVACIGSLCNELHGFLCKELWWCMLKCKRTIRLTPQRLDWQKKKWSRNLCRGFGIAWGQAAPQMLEGELWIADGKISSILTTCQENFLDFGGFKISVTVWGDRSWFSRQTSSVDGLKPVLTWGHPSRWRCRYGDFRHQLQDDDRET